MGERRRPEPFPARLRAETVLAEVKHKYAPDDHLAIFRVQTAEEDGTLVLRGEVDSPAARRDAIAAVTALGRPVRSEITVLPDDELDGKTWGIPTVSLLNVREKPGHVAELGTQFFMGRPFRVWMTRSNWFNVQSDDGYLGWAEGGEFSRCTPEEAAAWKASPLLLVTAADDRILESPGADALPVSDVVQGDLVQRLDEFGGWYKVRLEDGRVGYLPRAAATDYAAWKKTRQPTAGNIEGTAKSFLGRPYFWGGTSLRGLDCSGFTKLVFFLNGIDLARNASQQCQQGAEVPLDDDLAHLQKGDLVFFGRRARGSSPERIVHVGIYLGGRLFIQSSSRVRVSSLDPASPLADGRRIRTLLHARRILGEVKAGGS